MEESNKRAGERQPIGYELLLLFVTLLWGSTFVAQSVAMDNVKPFTFVFARFLISAVIVGLIAFTAGKVRKNAERKAQKTVVKIDLKRTAIGGFMCGLALFTASITQQYGLVTTTVGEGSFISSCYVAFVPVAGLLIGKKPPATAWLGVAMAVVGLYFISVEGGSGGLHISKGNLFMLASALCYTWQIMVIDHYSHGTDLLWMACFEFATIAVLSGIATALFEKPSLEAIKAAWFPIFYAGVVSGSFCYTLQMVAQKHIEATLASLIMGTEAVFATLSGWLILHEHIGWYKLIGCGLVMIAIVAAQLPGGALPGKAKTQKGL